MMPFFLSGKKELKHRDKVRMLVVPIIVLLILAGIGYLSLAQKAVRIKQVRLKAALIEMKISQSEYESALKRVTFLNILLDPKFVLSVD